MTESGEKLDLVVEPGAQNPSKQFQALYGGWRLFGHSIYGPDQTFTGVSCERMDSGPSYWGGRQSPRFMYGENLPSDEYRGSPFWSGLGLE